MDGRRFENSCANEERIGTCTRTNGSKFTREWKSLFSADKETKRQFRMMELAFILSGAAAGEASTTFRDDRKPGVLSIPENPLPCAGPRDVKFGYND